MADTTTTNYGYTKPEVGASEDSWGTKLNQNWTDIDADLKTVSDIAGITENTAESSIDSAADYLNVYDTSAGAVRKALVSDVVPSSFASGTLMLFQQTSAPTGWTKQTTHNDKALRVVSGAVSSGGTTAFSTAMATPSLSGSVTISGAPDAGTLAVSIAGDITVGNTTLSTSQIPSHSHGFYLYGAAGLSGADASGGTIDGSGGTFNTGGGGSHNHTASHTLAGTVTGAPGIGTIAGALSSGTAAINVQYVDLIIASKD